MTHHQPEAAQLTFIRPLQFGTGALVLLLAIYFGVVSLISGMNFALEQFAAFWYFIVPLALGFGIQVGLTPTSRISSGNTAHLAKWLRYPAQLLPPRWFPAARIT